MNITLRNMLFIIIFVFCFGTMPVLKGNVECMADEPYWNYNNSIVVKVSVPEEKSFTSADFPEVDNYEVIIVKKTRTEKGYDYGLIIRLAVESVEKCTLALDKIKKNSIVTDACLNMYAPHDEFVMEIDKSRVRLMVGESVDLKVTKLDIPPNDKLLDGIDFITNISSEPSKEEIVNTGIINYWPEVKSPDGIGVLVPPHEYIFQKSES